MHVNLEKESLIFFSKMQWNEYKVPLEGYMSSNFQSDSCISYESSDLSMYDNLINNMNSQLVIRSDDHFSNQENLQRPFFQFQGAIPTLISNARDTCRDEKTWIETYEENSNGEMDYFNSKETIAGFTDIDGDNYFSYGDGRDQFYNNTSLVHHDLFDVNDPKAKSNNQINVKNYEASEPVFNNNMMSAFPVSSYFEWDGDTDNDAESIS